ncbi:MAG TPA: outer membrane lipoprotein-sorting protein [Treponema sp.]|nr:MAG: outer membrane lipoprotein-sorting protein [Treponema sp. GWC1_61_84]OHE71959.1 MAG: outer membrane lipoprotein-sorting protein [Treponema sp. RIFOXYC1_FULL_61_9]HCM28413.1 outer membrane lipoprotein-sorting protein [Treponema sp.]
MKRIAIAALLSIGTTLLFSQNADEIVRASRDRIKSESVSTRSRMVISSKDGTTTERLVDQYAVEGPGGRKTLIVFQKPASVAGTRFLTIENPGKSDDRWIFLPALGKVRRVSAGEGSGSFMGSDFSYDDVSSADRGVEEDAHVLLREEELDGKACWVIESKPKDSGYQYSRMVSWIQKDSSIARRIEMFDKKGALLKILELGKIEDIQGRLTPKTTKMANAQTKTSTTIEVEILKYDDKIPEGVFTTRYLETGRP